jgi:hypothetical protein
MTTGTPPRQLFDTATAREVIAAGGVTGATIEAHAGGFFVRFRLASGGGVTLADKRRKQARRWRDLARAAQYVRELGIARMTLDLDDWQPRQRAI